MKTVISLIALLALLLFYTVSAVSETINFKDDVGNIINLDQPARKIVPLYGAFLEMLLYIGAKNEIAGRTKADEAIEEVKHLPSVGTHLKPNIEIILNLKPDLVVQSATRSEHLPELERLKEAHIPVATFAPSDFEGIFSTMERLGIASGHKEEAERKIKELRKRIDIIRAKLASRPKKPKVFFEIRHDPLTGAGRNSIVQAIFEEACVENIVKAEKPLVLFSLETLLAEDPDYYIIQRGPMNQNPSPLEKRPLFQKLKAVKNNHILWVNEFDFSRPTPKCVDTLEDLVKYIHGL